jgi:hypothetical protein
MVVAMSALLGAPANSVLPADIQILDLTGDEGQTVSQSEAVAWAKSRYQIAGLDLPDVVVAFRRGREHCDEMVGLWRGGDDGHRIDICIGGTGRRQQVLIHELGHVWIAEHLSDHDRDVFTDRRRLESWSHQETEWADRGTEQSAIIIAWGVDLICQAEEHLPDDDLQTLAADYRRLTGKHHVCVG